MTTQAPPGSVKGGVIQSRMAFVKDQKGAEAAERVLAHLTEEDRKQLKSILSASWYPFELNKRLDAAIAAEVGMGDKVFRLMGIKSAEHNLNSTHRAFIAQKDPHGLLKRAAPIYSMYYNTGNRTYEQLGEKKAALRTFESTTYSKEDCQTVSGWHEKAIEMCGGQNVRVSEARCRARGDQMCEYICEWD